MVLRFPSVQMLRASPIDVTRPCRIPAVRTLAERSSAGPSRVAGRSHHGRPTCHTSPLCRANPPRLSKLACTRPAAPDEPL